MKMTRMTTIILIALGVVLLAWVGVALFAGGGTKSAPAAADDRHCPECGRELPKAVRDSGGDCPFCKAQGKTVNVGQRRGGPPVLRGPAVPAALAGVVVVLLLVHMALLVRQRMRGRREEVIYHMNCRKCMRKLRYRDWQAGQLAKCPVCRTLIRFPQPDEGPRSRWPTALLGRILGR